MYYQHVLNLNGDELVYRFYTTQKLRPVKHDCVLMIDKDKADLGIQNMSDDEIRKISKNRFKLFIQKKINLIRYKNLKEVQDKQSKTKSLLM